MVLRKALRLFLFLLAFCAAALLFLTYYAAFKPNVRSGAEYFELFLTAKEGSNRLPTAMDTLLKDPCSFDRLRRIMGVKSWKPGHYLLRKGMSNLAILNKIRRGHQDPVKLTFNNVRDVYQLSGVFGRQLMVDSTEWVRAFADSAFLQTKGIEPQKLLCSFIPNTYQVYWTISGENLLARMREEARSFWEGGIRKVLADSLGLKPEEVYILASIVEKETRVEDEKGLIARVYLNRLQQGIKLQADPTVVFALGSTEIMRVLNEHLRVESPYNTYLYDGLPPGPIYMPSISTIDSVLRCPTHSYLFFCAKPGYEGRHAFAETLRGHAQNASQYRKWLDKERIR